jgi:hypothetical protein
MDEDQVNEAVAVLGHSTQVVCEKGVVTKVKRAADVGIHRTQCSKSCGLTTVRRTDGVTTPVKRPAPTYDHGP